MTSVRDIEQARAELEGMPARAVVRWALEQFGADCAIAFSGAEDVVLLHLAAASGLPFSVFTLDTGRLHPETYEFIDRVREHFNIAIAVVSPDAIPVEDLVRRKGLFSFYRDGHEECCDVRKVQPLRRVLTSYRAWMSGQRRDQNPATRGVVEVVQVDETFVGTAGPLVKVNPLAAMTSNEVWQYILDHDIPHNSLHTRGFRSIGCAPCTRPVLPGQHEREGRWWWESADKKECGLHVAASPREARKRNPP